MLRLQPAHCVTFFIGNVLSRLLRLRCLLFKAPPCDCCFALIASQSGGVKRGQRLNSAAITSMPLSRERAALCNLFRAAPYLGGEVGAAVCLANVVWKFGLVHASFMVVGAAALHIYIHWIQRCLSYWLQLQLLF